MGDEPGKTLLGRPHRQLSQPQRVLRKPTALVETAPARAELFNDVVDHPGVGGGRREHRVRSGKVVSRSRSAGSPGGSRAPVADAVGLADDEQAQRAARSGSCSSRNLGLLSRPADQEDVDGVGEQLGPDPPPVLRVGRGDRLGPMPARAAAPTWSRIRASSGETSRVGPAPRARSSAVATKYTADFPTRSAGRRAPSSRRCTRPSIASRLPVAEVGVRPPDQARRSAALACRRAESSYR